MRKTTLLALATGTLTALTDAQVAKYDYVITQLDRQSRMAGCKALNPNQKWFCYQNTELTNNLGSTGVSKTEMDANTAWFLRTLSTETYENSIIRDTPPHFWKLQETAGTVATDSGSSPANGTYNANQTLNQASLTGNAALKSVSFANVGGFATGFALNGTTNYTFEGWAIRTDSTSVDTILGSNGASGNRIILRCASGSNDISFYADSNIGGSSWFGALPAPGTAFHWAMTWDYTTQQAELFINGVSKGVINIGNAINSANVGSLTIGSWHSDLAHDPFKGRISHVSAWTTKLSAGRILAHYTNGPNTTTGGNAIVESQYYSGNWMADPGHTGYQARWNSNVISLLTAGGWDGVYADDIDFSPYFHSPTTLGDPSNLYNALTDEVYLARTRTQLISMYAPIHAAGFMVLGNISNAFGITEWTDFIGLIDGSTREFWKKFGNADSTGVTPVQPAAGASRFIDGDFDYDQSYFLSSMTTGRMHIPITYSVIGDTAMQRYGYATFLLDWDGGGSSYCFSLDTSTADPYSINWTKDIGTPIGAKYNVISDPDCWARNYTGGVILVNATATTKNIPLTGYRALNKTDGTLAGDSVNLLGADAEILSYVSQSMSAAELIKIVHMDHAGVKFGEA